MPSVSKNAVVDPIATTLLGVYTGIALMPKYAMSVEVAPWLVSVNGLVGTVNIVAPIVVDAV